MHKKIRVLVVSPYFLFPLDSGGRIRIFEIARGLSELNFEVVVIAPFFRIHRYPALSINDGLKIYPIRHPCAIIAFLLMDILFPYMVLASFHPAFRLLARKHLEAFDVYQFEHASFADLVDYIPPEKTVVYDAHNVEYDYVKSECRNKFAETLSLRKIYYLEKKLVLRCAKILACSEQDKKRFIELYGVKEDKILIIPNGIRQISENNFEEAHHAIKKFPKLALFKRRALFAGSHAEHNRVAVKFILSRLAPQLKNDCAFIIKGACGKNFKGYKGENIFIDSKGDGCIKSCAAVSTVAINTVTQGGGTSLKTLDYLAHNLPVISTEFGIRGYDDLKPFVTISDLNDFAKAILREQHLSPDVADVLRRYLWSDCASKVKDIYLSLLDKK